ncbi:hypothetical protein JKP88DRAFT_346679 [Tribonema minus]|uniref:SAM domain-containing protein n=1 Tax=Tribonema minus TaxID=303371 RepID=A0A835YTG8_9STRA|nr:hypothetical protein JKP88DRAFT_346679 [Tribonema minus]
MAVLTPVPLLVVLLLSLPTVMWLAYRGSSYLLGQWDSSSSSSSAQAARSSVQDAVIVNDKAAAPSPKAAEPDAAEILARAAAEDLLDFDARLGTTGSYLSPDALAAGLAAEGLAAYAAVLRRAGVDSAVAATVTEDDLRTELGVTALGDRRRLLAYLQRVARR